MQLLGSCFSGLFAKFPRSPLLPSLTEGRGRGKWMGGAIEGKHINFINICPPLATRPFLSSPSTPLHGLWSCQRGREGGAREWPLANWVGKGKVHTLAVGGGGEGESIFQREYGLARAGESFGLSLEVNKSSPTKKC